MEPTIGRIVHYILSANDVEQINREYSSHHCNPHDVNQHVPAIICVVWPNEYGPNYDGCNLQVFLDGNIQLWRTSIKEDIIAGTWHWPERKE